MRTHDGAGIAEQKVEREQRHEEMKHEDGEVRQQSANPGANETSDVGAGLIHQGAEIERLRAGNVDADTFPPRHHPGELPHEDVTIEPFERRSGFPHERAQDDEPRPDDQRSDRERGDSRRPIAAEAAHQLLVPGVHADGEHRRPAERTEEWLKDAQQQIAEQQHDAVEDQRREAFALAREQCRSIGHANQQRSARD